MGWINPFTLITHNQGAVHSLPVDLNMYVFELWEETRPTHSGLKSDRDSNQALGITQIVESWWIHFIELCHNSVVKQNRTQVVNKWEKDVIQHDEAFLEAQVVSEQNFQHLAYFCWCSVSVTIKKPADKKQEMTEELERGRGKVK